jgi:Fanconi anemia group M protein
MCGNLRNASAQEMRDFVQGKRMAIAKNDNKMSQRDTVVEPKSNLSTTITAPAMHPPRVNNPYANSNKSKARNPYAAASSSSNADNSTTSSEAITAASAARPPSNCDPPPPPQQQQQQLPSASTGPSTTSPKYQGIDSFFAVRKLPPTAAAATSTLSTTSETAKSPPHSKQPLKRTSYKQDTFEKKKPPPKDESVFIKAAQRATSYEPGPVALDSEAARQWVYPVHDDFPMRNYQLEISHTAIFANTLVSLPTGLGKTLIAAVVLYNYYQWFPTGKVIFLAPTLPLVDQQVQACYRIMGIPAHDTAVLNGRVAPKERQGHWTQRRVFFCTPQTVERDLEAGTCPAQQVVCLVLDEAHKATGNFAYCKVVELCEKAGARFRILGLSATPGAKVEQVQKVIDALRISRVEVRSEDDPSVKQYIHERHNEIVVVKRRTICSQIEELFNKKLVEPIMTKLRTETSARSKLGPNDNTLTSFTIHMARQHHHETTNDHRHDGYFAAAQKLVDARSNLHTHGIGSVRGKLLELRNNPQRGVLASIVKSDDFNELFNAVMKASSGENSQETIEDKKANNPKLRKLDEILNEHFLRAEACKESSRAIVFSQWRDSVSEIVEVLNAGRPLIRPRHFVGQSSVSGKNGELKGMSQKEQQKAIQEFQEGHFNVLVCTSIGEEGLDIGQVDLIVNYDTLRSPIRMIQRVGRTGRKRDGRVVCLVSEGQEQDNMVKSKNKEKSLLKALRQPDNFKLRPNQIMFPAPPELYKKNMQIKEKLRLSQVGGIAAVPERKKKSGDEADYNHISIDPINWKLTDQKENIRLHTFGNIDGVTSIGDEFPLLVRKKLLRARARAYAGNDGGRYARRVQAGASRRLLLTIEAPYADRQVSGRKFRAVLDRDGLEIFPLDDTNCNDKNVVVNFKWDERLPRAGVSRREPLAQLSEAHPSPDIRNSGFLISQSNDGTRRAYAPNPCGRQRGNPLQDGKGSSPAGRSNDIALQGGVNAHPEETTFATRQAFMLTSTENEHRGSTCNSLAVLDQGLQSIDKEIFESLPPDQSLGDINADEKFSLDYQQSRQMRILCNHTNAVQSPSFSPPMLDEHKKEARRSSDSRRDPLIAAVDFRLPTPPSSSSSESETSDEEDLEIAERADPPRATLSSDCFPSSNFDRLLTNYNEVAKISESNYKANTIVAFRLPTQDSSSDESSKDDDESTARELIAINTTCSQYDDTTLSSVASKGTLSAEKSAKVHETSQENNFIYDLHDETSLSVRESRNQSECLMAESGFADNPATAECTSSAIGKCAVEVKTARRQKHHLLYSQSPCDETQDSTRQRGLPQDLNLAHTPSDIRDGKGTGEAIVAPMSMLKNTAGRNETPSSINQNPAVFDLVDTPSVGGTENRTQDTIIASLSMGSNRARIKNASPSCLIDTPSIGPGQEARFDSSSQELIDTPDVSKERYIKSIEFDDSSGLIDTPQDESPCAMNEHAATYHDDDVVCLVCQSGESPDDDPIVLCDGPSQCSVAVHASCYSLEPSFLHTLDKWYCDICKASKENPNALKPVCFVCQRSRGALKRYSPSSDMWVHPYCMSWYSNEEDVAVICKECSFPGARLCGFDSCSESAHPHCAVEMSLTWLTVVDALNKKTLIFCPKHRHEQYSRIRWMKSSDQTMKSKCIVLPSARVSIMRNGTVSDDGDRKMATESIRGPQPSRRLKKKAHFDPSVLRPCQPKRLQKMKPAKTDGALESKKQRKREGESGELRCGLLRSKFIESEALIDSDEDMEGDDEELDELQKIDEEEELAALDFINDSSQLGYSQDELDKVDPGESQTLHRMFDVENERKRQFSTPIFNRRMRIRRDTIDSQDSDAWGASPSSSKRSSLKGLGNCHFIRSVIEHARQGGDAEDIEALYNEIAKNPSQDEDADEERMRAQPAAPSRGPIIMEYVPSDED